MRDIEFRGKRIHRIKNKQWQYGSLIVGHNRFDIVTEVKSTGEIDFVMVDPETVGQYTGLADKNGVKIFEGDIVDGIRVGGLKGAVIFVNSSFWICTQEYTIKYIEYELYKYRNLEVIANIHDNPELLEVGDGNKD